MKEIIPLQINAFGYDITRNSCIEDALGYANDHDNEKEAMNAINGVCPYTIYSHKPLVTLFQQVKPLPYSVNDKRSFMLCVQINLWYRYINLSKVNFNVRHSWIY